MGEQNGDFRHMVIVDDWCAIHYDVTTVNRENGAEAGSCMQFLHFEENDGKCHQPFRKEVPIEWDGGIPVIRWYDSWTI